MGLVFAKIFFGKVVVETPKYEVIKAAEAFEIRKYLPQIIAEITYDPSTFKGDKDGGFSVLANYIGVLGKPQNTKPEKIAMTSPVITKSNPEKIAMTSPVITKSNPEKIAMTSPVITKSSEKISMTSPVITKGSGEGEEKKSITMQFTLPSKYTKVEEVPVPVDERVVIREEGERKYGVVVFSGSATDKVVETKVENLKKELEKNGYKIVGDYVLGRYNPPWTLPPLRTNEVLIPVE